MTQLKTLVNDRSPDEFVETIADEQKKEDCKQLLTIFAQATGLEPKMWGSSIVGYGSYHYKSERSKQEGDWPLTGFAPRKQALTIYIMPGFDQYQDLLAKLGPHKKSVSCLYIKKLFAINEEVLEQIIAKSTVAMKERYGVY